MAVRQRQQLPPFKEPKLVAEFVFIGGIMCPLSAAFLLFKGGLDASALRALVLAVGVTVAHVMRLLVVFKIKDYRANTVTSGVLAALTNAAMVAAHGLTGHLFGDLAWNLLGFYLPGALYICFYACWIEWLNLGTREFVLSGN